MTIESDITVNRGKRLFFAIVIISIFLQLVPNFLMTDLRVDLLISRLSIPIAGVILYLFLAYETYRGKSWARILIGISHLGSLLFSIPTVALYMSHTQVWEIAFVFDEVVSIFFSILAALTLFGSRSLIAFVRSNRNHQNNMQPANEGFDTEIVNQSKSLLWFEKVQLHRTILGIGIFILFTQYIWKILYAGGILPGAYWLFYYLDEGFFVSIVFTFSLAGIVFLLWVASRFLAKEISMQLMKIIGALMFVGAGIIITFPVVLARNTVFIERLQAENKIYYLSAYPMFSEVNYSVAECEFTGQICRTIFVSSDILGTNWQNSYLEYNENSNEIILIEDQEGIIFSKVIQ